jgi:hypothetical protein
VSRATACSGKQSLRPNGPWRTKDRPQLNQLALDEALDTEALLLGRRSYEWLAARWPSRTGAGIDNLEAPESVAMESGFAVYRPAVAR